MKYVCIAIHSTAQAKYWNNKNGWQKIVDYLKSKDYEVVLISYESGNYMGNEPPENIIDKTGKSIDDVLALLKDCEFFIGISSGLSWLAWAVGVPVILISGFTKPWYEFLGENVYRIFNSNVCNGCFNDSNLMFDKGDWNWCPRNKNFECSKSIASNMVIKQIDKIIGD